MNRSLRTILTTAAGCLLGTLALAHSGDQPPLFVADGGHDAGDCQDAANPCRTLGYALGELGKGGLIRVASGSYTVAGDNELFHLLNGSIDIRGGFVPDDRYGVVPEQLTVLSGVPREFAAAMRERGFFVAADSKATDRDSFKTVAGQLKAHAALQSSMAATPCVGGSVNGMACENVDLLSHVASGDVSAQPGDATDVWGFVDLNTHREYALVGFDIGTAVFDVTDAENPREIGFVDGQFAFWRDIKVHQFWNAAEGRWNAQAYVTTDGTSDGLFVIDLSGLPQSIARGSYASDFSAAHNVYTTNTDYGTGVSLTGAAPTVIIAGSNSGAGQYRAYTLGNPNAPSFEVMPGSGAGDYMHDASSMIITDDRKDSQCVNATTYCEVLFDFNESTFDIWDVTQTNNPVRLSRTTYANASYVHSGWWSEDRQTLFIHDELDERDRGLNTTLRAYDLSNLAAPTSAGTWTGPTRAIDHNGFVRGNRYYMSNYSRGLTILDITDPGDLQAVGRIDTYPASDNVGFVGAWGAYPFFHSGNVAISDIDSGFYMVADRTLSVPEGRIALSSRSYGGNEGSQLQIPVQRLDGSAGAVSVNYEVLGATAGSNDIAGGSGTLNWADGETGDQTITIDLLSDGETGEGLEQLFVRLLAPTGGATLDYANIASVYVGEAGAAASVGFADAEVRVTERGFATAVVVLQRRGSAAGAASVEYAISGGDATAGSDFQGAGNGVVNWADGDATPKWIEFAITDDGAAEPDETIELTLQNATGASLGTATMQVVIANGAGQSRAPNAIAGPGQTRTAGSRVTLDGSGSNDPDGDTLTYQWTQTSGPTVTLDNANTATASFTAPSVTSDTLLQFELTVSDGLFQDSSTTSITVQQSTPTANNNGGGGGGGTLSLWLLATLAATSALRRRRTVRQR